MSKDGAKKAGGSVWGQVGRLRWTGRMQFSLGAGPRMEERGGKEKDQRMNEGRDHG